MICNLHEKYSIVIIVLEIMLSIIAQTALELIPSTYLKKLILCLLFLKLHHIYTWTVLKNKVLRFICRIFSKPLKPIKMSRIFSYFCKIRQNMKKPRINEKLSLDCYLKNEDVDFFLSNLSYVSSSSCFAFLSRVYLSSD